MDEDLTQTVTVRIESSNGHSENRLVASPLRLNDELYEVFENTLIGAGFDKDSIHAFFSAE